MRVNYIKSDFKFKLMKISLKLKNFFSNEENRIDQFGIRKGTTVVDYGCGPGLFIKRASQYVGEDGIVYAVDIHPSAIDEINKIIEKNNLTNVKPYLTKDSFLTDIPDNEADMIYAMDVYHSIKETNKFLKEMRRIIKKTGYLIIEDAHGHIPKAHITTSVRESGLWQVDKEFPKYIRFKPI